MHTKKANPFYYENGKTKIRSAEEKPHYVKMMWFDLIMKWVIRLGWLLAIVIINFF